MILLMPRRRTHFAKDHFYHIFSRGNRQEAIFAERRDYQRFLDKLEEYRKEYRFDILAYCLLLNHFHLLLKQLSSIPVSKLMASLQSSHSHYFSLKHNLPSGQFFQGRFGSTFIQADADLLQVSRYIHLNPIKEDLLRLDFTPKKSRAFRQPHLIRRLRTYPWSSYSTYLDQKAGPVSVNTSFILAIEKKPARYRRFVEARITDADAQNLESF